jgi:flagellar biosynthetic protein FliQ
LLGPLAGLARAQAPPPTATTPAPAAGAGALWAVGIIIALLQALTQVQEITLTFIPKIIAILLISSFTAPFIGAVIFTFAEHVYGRIEHGF